MKDVAILVDTGYEDLEFWYPKLRFQEAGYKVACVHLKAGEEFMSKHGYKATSDKSVSDIDPDDLQGVIIPGGWAPDNIRQHDALVNFVREMYNRDKLVGAICHGGSVLVSAGIAKGKNVTSYRSIRDDLVAAGAEWIDKDVVCDGNLITSRTPSDLPAFMFKILENLSGKAQNT